MILTIPGLHPGQDYSVQVRVKTDETTSEWSPSFNFATDSTGPIPATPENAVWMVSGDSFYGEWDRVDTDESGVAAVIIRYEMALSVGGSVRTISVPQSKADRIGYTLTFSDNAATFGTAKPSIGMRVRAVNSIGTVSDWTNLITATNPAPEPLAAIDVEPMVNAINVSWPLSEESDAEYYNLQWSDSGSGPWSTIYTGPQNAYVHSNSLWNDDSFYRVAVIDKFGTFSTYVNSVAVRPASAFGADTTPPNNPTSITASPGFDAVTQNAFVDVAWNASSSTDVGSYVVRYSTDNTTWQYMTVDGDRTGARLNNLIPGTNYYVSVRAKDTSGNVAIAWSNASTYPVLTTKDTSAPATPATPSAVSGSQRIQVTHSGLNSTGGAMDADVDYYQVHASITSGFTANSTTQLGTIPAGPAIVGVFQIPASNASGTTQTWYVRVRAVDRAGNVSPVSAQVSASVGLIATANIGDAQITTAKISSLEANKITAGTGLINNLTVKSKLTLGDASTVGSIESYDYTASAGATGFTMSKNGMVIKTGQIEAAALRIQAGSNLVPSALASFEVSDLDLYTSATPVNVTADLGFTNPKQGTRYAAVSWTNTSSVTPIFYLSKTATGYNLVLDTSKTYIISAFLRSSGSTPVSMEIKNSVGSSNVFTAATTGTWQRFSGVYSPSAENNLLAITSTATTGGSFEIDCIQVEERIGSINTPSTWSPGGVTNIDGGQIITGSIASSAPALDAEGNPISGLRAWSIDTEGQANLGNALVRGRLIVGDGSGPAVDPETGEETTIAGASQVQSYNYVDGISGWVIRSNGVAEFRQLKANSIDGSKLIIDSVDADRIRSDAIAARHISAGAISADKFASEIILSSKIIIGNEYSTANLDPAGLNPNMVPPISDDNIVTLADDTGPYNYTMPNLGAWGQRTTGSNTWSASSTVADYSDAVFFNGLIADGAPSWTTTMAAGGPSDLSLRTKVANGHVADIYRITYGVRATGGSATVTGLYPIGAGYNKNNDKPINHAKVSDATGIVWVDVLVQRYSTNASSQPWATTAGNFLMFNVVTATAGTTIEIISPQMRNWDIPSNNVAWAEENSDTSPGFTSNAPEASLTKWDITGTSLPSAAEYTGSWMIKPQSTDLDVYDANSVTAVTPTFNRTSGSLSYSVNGESRGIEQAIRASTQASGTFSLINRLPLFDVPEQGNGWTTWLTFRVSPSADKAWYNKTQVGIYWYDASNNVVSSIFNLWEDGTSYQPKMTAKDGGQFLVKVPPIPETATHGMVRFTSWYQGNTMPLAEYARLFTGSVRVFSLENINHRYGEISGSRIEQSTDGITLLNAENQPQVRLPVDSQETAFFKGAGEFGSLRVLGGLSLESTGNEIAKDSKLTLSNGITSPGSSITIQQKYETIQCDKGTFDWNEFTLNWTRVTSMVYHPTSNRFIISEIVNGKLFIWWMAPDGAIKRYQSWTTSGGYSQVALFLKSTDIAGDTNGDRYSYVSRKNNELVITHHPGSGDHWTNNYVESGAPNGPFFANTNQPAAWWSSDGKLVMAQNVSGTRAWIKRYTLSSTGGTYLTSAQVYDVPAGGAGGLAGGYEGSTSFGGSRWVLSDRFNTSVVKVVDEAAKTRVSSEEWPPAGVPVAFCRGPEGFVQVDSNGVMTKYSDWTWSATNDKIYAGVTWLDDDPAGTGPHETDLTNVVSATLKKRIGYIQITGPQVPDKNGNDDPNKFRLYVARSTSTLTLPANRTSFWSQYEGGSPSAQTTVIIPQNGIQTGTANPPSTNNFPGTGPGELHSFASDASGSLISLKGNGAFRLGDLSLNGPPDIWHDVGTPGEPAFENSWQTYNSAAYQPSFRKMSNGEVIFRGTVARVGNAGYGTSIFTLPPGYRPPANTTLITAGNLLQGGTGVTQASSGVGAGRVDIFPDGRVMCYTTMNSSGWLALPGIRFNTFGGS